MLFCVLVFATAVRVVGLDYGLPFPLRSDEESILGGALRMLELRSVIPAFHPAEMTILNYPPYLPYAYLAVVTPYLLGLYAMLGFPALQDFAITVFDHMGAIFLLARGTSVLFSVATVWLVYRIGTVVFRSQWVGIAGAGLLSCEFFSVFTAHFARHWNATTLTVWLAVFLACLIVESPTRRRYLLLGCVSGVGFGVSYIFGGLGIVAGVLAHLAVWFHQRAGFFDRRMLEMIGAFIVLSVVAILLYPNALLRLTVGEVGGLDETKSVPAAFASLAYYATILWRSDPILLTLAAIGIATGVMRRDARTVTLCWTGVILFYFVFLYLTVNDEDRYSITAMPAFSLLGGYAIVSLFQWARTATIRIAVGAFLVIAIAFPVTIASQASLMLSRDDTRLQAKTWIETSLPKSAKIANGLHHVKLKQSAAGLQEQQRLDADSLHAFERLALGIARSGGSQAERLFSESYYVVNVSDLTGEQLSASIEPEFLNYLTGNEFTYYVGQFRDPSRITPLHRALRTNAELVAQFRATEGSLQPPYLQSTELVPFPLYKLIGMERFGPTVEIFRLP